MSNAAGHTEFEISLSSREDGTLAAAYVHVTPGSVAKSTEIVRNTLVADYDANGVLIGFEVLGPVRIADMVALVESSMQPAFERFAEQTLPPSLRDAA